MMLSVRAAVMGVVCAVSAASGQVGFDPAVPIGGLNGARDVLAVDIDGDLDLDLVVVSQDADTVHVFKNNGNGTFAAPAAITGFQNPFRISAGDVDCDGDLDLCIIDANLNTMTVLRNNGSGTFSSPTSFSTAAAPRIVRLADLDDDGRLDAVVLTQLEMVSVLRNTGAGSFAPRVDYPLSDTPSSLQLGDIDRDGDVDMVIGFPTGVANTVDIRTLKNNGNGTFAPAVGQILSGNCTGMTIGDLDGDADLDLVLFHQFQGAASLAVWRNDGTGNFVSGQRLNLGGGSIVVVADMNGDSLLDIIAGNSGSFRVYLNSGTGTFQGQTLVTSGTQTEALAVGDIDRDGDVDVVTANRVSDDVKLYFQTGSGVVDDTIDIPSIVISELAHSYIKDPGLDLIHDRVDFSSQTSLYTNQGFVASFREGNEVVVRVEAPAGHRFAITPPTSDESTVLSLAAYWLEAGFTLNGISLPPVTLGTHTFENPLGTAPSIVQRRDRVTCDGGRVEVSWTFNIDQPFSFTALELRFAVTTAPPDQTKVYGPVSGGWFGIESRGEAMPDQVVMMIQPNSSPTTVAFPPVVIEEFAHTYGAVANPPGTNLAADRVIFPSGPGQGSGPGFTVSYGPDDEILLRVEPLPGTVFRVNALPGASTTQVIVSLNWYQGTSFMPVSFYPTEITWVGLEGATPSVVTNNGRVNVGGASIQAGFRVDVVGPIEFEAIEMRFPSNGNPVFEQPIFYYPLGMSSTVDNPFGVSRVEAEASGIGLQDSVVMEMIAPPPPCPADANGDNMVNGADLSVLLGQFGQSVTPGTGADFNGDGAVNGADLSVLLGQFGSSC